MRTVIYEFFWKRRGRTDFLGRVEYAMFRKNGRYTDWYWGRLYSLIEP